MGDQGRRRLCVTIVVTVFAAVAACSGGDDDKAGSERGTTEATSAAPTETTATTTATTAAPTTTTGATTTTRPPTPEGQITADYLAYWAAYDQLAANPGGDIAALEAHASGPALESARQEVDDLRSQGQRVEAGAREEHNAYGPAVIDAQTAYVADCHVAEVRVVDAGGEVVRSDPSGGRPETIAATLVRGPDRWLVDSLEYYDLAPGETCSPSGPVAG